MIMMLFMVIGDAFEDCPCSVELFKENDPGQFVGKGHGAQAKAYIRAFKDLVTESIRPADDKTGCPARIFQPGLELF